MRQKPLFYVYRIDSVDGLPLYVGKGTGTRCASMSRRNPDLKIAMMSGLTRPAIKVRELLTECEAYALEIALIAELGRLDLGTGSLLNKNGGGAGGVIPGPETRAKMRAAKKGWKPPPFSAEHRARLAAARKGVKLGPLSEEHKAKLRAANVGRKHSDETRAKMRQSMRGLKRSVEARARMNLSKKGVAPIAANAACRGKSLSAEHRAKLSVAHRGKKLPPRSAEHCAKLSAARKGKNYCVGRIVSAASREKNRLAHLGKHASAETRAKMRRSHLGCRRGAEIDDVIECARRNRATDDRIGSI
jgi:hypothetical protein